MQDVDTLADTVGDALCESDRSRHVKTRPACACKSEMLIRNRGHVNFETLVQLIVAPATLKRDLDYLKGYPDALIVYGGFLNGYFVGEEHRGQKFERLDL